MKSESVSAEIQRMIVDVGLPHKRTALAKDLSGIIGMLWFLFPHRIFLEEINGKVLLHTMNTCIAEC